VEERLYCLELLLREDVLRGACEGHLCLLQFEKALLADRDIRSYSRELHLRVDMAALNVIDHLKEGAYLRSVDFVHAQDDLVSLDLDLFGRSVLEEVEPRGFRGEHHPLLSSDLEVAHRCSGLTGVHSGETTPFRKLALVFEPAHVVVSITLSQLGTIWIT